jgi:lipid A ethanolaminephosphotransferase
MRRQYSLITVILLFSAYHMMAVQGPLMDHVLRSINSQTVDGIVVIFTVALIQLCLFAALLGVLSIISIWLMRAVAGVLMIVDVVAFYFMNAFGILLNQEMIANILNTDTGEVGGLIDWRIFAWGFGLGVVPALLMLFVPIKAHRYWTRFILAPVAVACIAGALMAWPKTNHWIQKNELDLGSRILPWSYIVNTVRYFDQDHARYLRDQVILPDPISTPQAGLVILAIGESARAQNFAWYGYDRDTNPFTRSAGFRALPPSDACATATIGGTACILSRRGRDERKGEPEEPLPSYLKRQGVATYVYSNNTGLPRIKSDGFYVGSQLSEICEGGFCAERYEDTCDGGMCSSAYPDSILTSGLSDLAKRAVTEPVFLLLHFAGSHGPNYFEKYPHRYAAFEPICTDKMLPNCALEDLRNVYDNTILYSDRVLAEIVKDLERVSGLNALVLYTSDHGESLGEDGIYTHAAPIEAAPEYQLKVPFLFWQSAARDAAPARSDVAAQDAMFHTVLGAFGLTEGGVYQPDGDVFSSAD